MDQILVSVVMITYGHEKYIDKAIRGVLMQKCNFDVELIIADDCSPDDTPKIIKNILQEHPKTNWIRYIRHTKNIGILPNFLFSIDQAEGKYIAMCEGDDYWTDPNKLQRQVDFLENNDNYSIVFTDYEILDKKNIIKANLQKKLNHKYDFNLNDIILKNFIPTLTVLFRNNKIIFPENFVKCYPGDWPLHILNARYGYIKFLPINTAVYRIHEGGVCSSSNPLYNLSRYLKTLKLIRGWFKNNFTLQILLIFSQLRIYGSIVYYLLKVWLKKK